MRPSSDCVGKIVGVNGVAGAPTSEFLERAAEVFQNLSVDVFDRTVRRHDHDEARDGIHEQPQALLSGMGRVASMIGRIRTCAWNRRRSTAAPI
jgi:hypothetical protein